MPLAAAEVAVWELLLLLLIPAIVAAAVITAMKGRWVLFILGFVLSPIFWAIGAMRLGRPDSHWAKRRYDPQRTERAAVRFAPKHGQVQ